MRTGGVRLPREISVSACGVSWLVVEPIGKGKKGVAGRSGGVGSGEEDGA